MALPYIDTQRLSLVWLNLVPPSDILKLEAELIGSREIRGVSRSELTNRMTTNSGGLPEAQVTFCQMLQKGIGPDDGFRRKAVPSLLYRYFEQMQRSFRATYSMLKNGGRFALVVGHNHTVLKGERYDIDTPHHLANLAEYVGWHVDELLQLQTYQRYGYHTGNAVRAESLLFLRKR